MTPDGRQTFIEYAAPEHVPARMADWLAELKRLASGPLSEPAAIDADASTRALIEQAHAQQAKRSR
ncbi:hypothetical protein [Thiocystis minor]|uniref:hypothetical protein n=1 Tax=Thiocystis minor TaxID=61597 RepID=UPI0019132B4B|nr:hypothetical protein [Thiocystis minor]